MPIGQHSWPNHRRDGTAGLFPAGMTKADTVLQLNEATPNSLEDRLKKKKRDKQRRHRNNKATREKQTRIRERREHKTREGKTIFYLPSRRDKLRERRASHRREYRKFMRKMVSELSKKVGRDRLKRNKNKTRAALFTNSSFVNKLAALQKRQKHEFRIQWHKKNSYIWEQIAKITSQKPKEETS